MEFTITVEREPFKLMRVEGAEPDFAARIETVASGKTYKVIVSSSKTAAAGRHAAQLKVVTDSDLLPFIPIAISSRVQPDSQ
jgi:hypothetical protein